MLRVRCTVIKRIVIEGLLQTNIATALFYRVICSTINDRFAHQLPSFRVILSEHSESKDPYLIERILRLPSVAQNDMRFRFLLR